LLDDVYSHFQRSGQDDAALTALLGPRIGTGAGTLARVWDMAVEEADVDDYPQNELRVDEPAFIPVAEAQSVRR
jgi:hypothetical protein